MNNYKTFAAIYKKDKNNKYFELDNVALVEYIVEGDFFVVKTGKYSGATSYNFNRLFSEKDSILECQQEIYIHEEDKDLDYIYIFDKIFYVDRMKGSGFFSNILLKLADDLYPIKLYRNNDGTIYTKRIDKKKNDFDYSGLSAPIKNEPDDSMNTEEKEKFDKAFNNLISGLLAISVISAANDMISEQDNQEDKRINDSNIDDSISPNIFPFAFSDISRGRIETAKQLRQKLIEAKEKQNTTQNNPKKVNEMIETISSKIVGQRKVIETLVSNIYYNQVLIDYLTKNGTYDPSRLDSSRVAILLDGSTGTGKTAIEKEIARMLDLPIVITNANSFSETGYVGPTITDILNKLLDQANGNLEKAERGIIVLDEIDKVASKENIYGKDMDRGVQEELLSFIGGGEYDLKSNELFSKPIRFDTSKITFILSGAFTDLREEKIKEEEKKNKPMGFNTTTSKSNSYEITPEDYIKYGLMREFFGRIKVLTSTKSYKLEDLKKILLTSVISPLKNFENSVKMFGYSGISYDEDFVTELATVALEMGTGARSLQTIMSGIQSNMLMGLINQEFDKEKPIKLEKKLIYDYKKTNIREI
ncbi:MAG: AAA family ATPase [Bacilli bacterium]|nr:AAA family ATPase [Bacilli bacterium]